MRNRSRARHSTGHVVTGAFRLVEFTVDHEEPSSFATWSFKGKTDKTDSSNFIIMLLIKFSALEAQSCFIFTVYFGEGNSMGSGLAGPFVSVVHRMCYRFAYGLLPFQDCNKSSSCTHTQRENHHRDFLGFTVSKW